MRVVFFGTPDYILPILDLVQREFSRRGVSPIAAVVTQPPRPTGRKQMREFSPVDSWAFKKGLPILHSSRELIGSEVTADLGVLAAYGEIIPESVIGYFPFGILNVHPSLLPKWRGASPVQASILAGEKETGVSIIKLDKQLDHGPIVAQFKESVFDSDNTETLRQRLFERSAEVVVQLIEPYLQGKISPRPQAHSEATFTTQIKKEHAFIPPAYLKAALQGSSFKGRWEIGFLKDFSITPTVTSINQFIKAMTPWPGAWTYVSLGKSGHEKDKKRFKIIKARVEGAILILDQVQLEGKGPVSWGQFREAYPQSSFREK